MDLARVQAVMGPVPRLDPSGFTDFTGSLDKHEQQRLNKARTSFTRTFPQINVYVVFSRFRTDFPIPVTLFWMFNLGGLGIEDQKLGNNRDLFIAVDPQQSLAAVTTGYGLEPYLCAETIDDILEQTSSYFQTGDLASAVVKLMQHLSQTLKKVARELPINSEGQLQTAQADY